SPGHWCPWASEPREWPAGAVRKCRWRSRPWGLSSCRGDGSVLLGTSVVLPFEASPPGPLSLTGEGKTGFVGLNGLHAILGGLSGRLPCRSGNDSYLAAKPPGSNERRGAVAPGGRPPAGGARRALRSLLSYPSRSG